jgi:hypothetical protein
LTEETAEISLSPVDNAAIDVSEEGSWLICAERTQIVSAENFSNTADRILGRMEEHGTFLDLSPLRLILLTLELHNRAKDWQRHLGRPETLALPCFCAGFLCRRDNVAAGLKRVVTQRGWPEYGPTGKEGVRPCRTPINGYVFMPFSEVK